MIAYAVAAFALILVAILLSERVAEWRTERWWDRHYYLDWQHMGEHRARFGEAQRAASETAARAKTETRMV